MSPTHSDPRATLATMWQTRPTRRQSDRKVAGVAAAIARRYDVDPVLVRIGFVVAALYGVGILLYFAAWATLEPDPNDPPRGPLAHGTVVRWLLYLALVIATLGAIHDLVTGDLDLLVGLLVVGGLLYLLQTSRGDRGLEPARTDQPGPAGTADPAGTAPTGPSAPTGPRSRVTPVTIAVMLVAAGVTGAVLPLGDPGLPGPRLLVGVMLAVVGIGLLIGSFTRGGRGLILLAVPLLLAGYGVNRLPAQHWQGTGELRAAPTSVSEVAASYDRTFGRVELDLRKLDLGTAAGPPGTAAPGLPPSSPEPVRTRVSLQLGEATVRVPANADVRVHCHADVGDVDCLGERSSGPDNRQGGPTADVQVDNLGSDGIAGGRPLELDVTVGTGHVEVRRG